VHWHTEAVDESAYQLVTTGYVATPSENGSGDETVLTPVRLNVGLDPEEGSGETSSDQTSAPHLVPVDLH
jgi:hypothetical protein